MLLPHEIDFLKRREQELEQEAERPRLYAETDEPERDIPYDKPEEDTTTGYGWNFSGL